MLRSIVENNRAHSWKIGTEIVPISSMPLIMGIVNVTPDSFFDGGKYNTLDLAYEHAVSLLRKGANILDIGGESSRPGSTPISEQEELDRVCPLVEALVQLQQISENINNPGNKKFFISIDTVKSNVAKECIKLGAHIINDISACSMDSNMVSVIANSNASIILNHMRGNFGTMQSDFIPYNNVVEDVYNELKSKKQELIHLGVDPLKICIDPGIGFGKSTEDNLNLIKSIEKFLELDSPILVGTSRKSYIEKLNHLENSDKLIPTITAGIISVLGGASILRVHDVFETKESILYLEALRSYGNV